MQLPTLPGCHRSDMDVNTVNDNRECDFRLFLDNTMIVGGVDMASDGDMHLACTEMLESYQASNAVLFGRLGYILLVATAGTSIQVEAMPVGGASSLSTIVPCFKVSTLASCYDVVCRCLGITHLHTWSFSVIFTLLDNNHLRNIAQRTASVSLFTAF